MPSLSQCATGIPQRLHERGGGGCRRREGQPPCLSRRSRPALTLAVPLSEQLAVLGMINKTLPKIRAPHEERKRGLGLPRAREPRGSARARAPPHIHLWVSVGQEHLLPQQA